MPVARRVLALALLALTLSRAAAAQPAGAPPRIAIRVDAAGLPARRIPVRLTLAGASGPVDLVFPRWLPGMHALEGPLGNFARLSITEAGAPLAWNRDPFDPYIIHVDAPAGSGTIEASYDYVPAKNRADEVFFGVAADHELAVINPAAFSLAPKGDPRAQQVAFSISLPKGWTAATALPVRPAAGAGAGTFECAPVSLYTLIDSPIMAGSHRRTIPLAIPPGDVPHTLELFADTEEVLQTKAPVVTPLLTRLVAESGRMFATRHYRSFRFMLALTTEIGRNGLEHHEGVAYVLQPDDLDENKKQLAATGWNEMLIAHEFTHSWNGKFRRPYGQDVASSVAPQSADLIWVYEGLTEYLSDVLMVRSGFRSFAGWRHDLTARASGMRFGQGRDWESVADAALVAPYTYVQGAGTALRGVGDVYYESELAWLEADAIIRRESKGARSLDDFCRLFFGGLNRGPEIVRYTRQDVADALQRTQPYDWNGFIRRRFYAPPSGLPTAGLEAAGWKLTFADRADAPSPGQLDYRFTLGAAISATGRIGGVVPGSAADRAGLEDGMTLLGVDGSLFTPTRLQDAVRATKGRKAPVELLVADDSRYRTVRLDGLDGERFPALTRDPARPDLLAAITAPTAGAATTLTAHAASSPATRPARRQRPLLPAHRSP
jgi:predicted metalloprotease with PDZ domain